MYVWFQNIRFRVERALHSEYINIIDTQLRGRLQGFPQVARQLFGNLSYFEPPISSNARAPTPAQSSLFLFAVGVNLKATLGILSLGILRT